MDLSYNIVILFLVLLIAIIILCICFKRNKLLQNNTKKNKPYSGGGFQEEKARDAFNKYTKSGTYVDIHASQPNICGIKGTELHRGCKYPCERQGLLTQGLNWLYRMGITVLESRQAPINNKSTCLDMDGYNSHNNLSFEYNGPTHYFMTGINTTGINDYFNSKLHEEIRIDRMKTQNEKYGNNKALYRFIVVPYIWYYSNNIENYVISRLRDCGELKDNTVIEQSAFDELEKQYNLIKDAYNMINLEEYAVEKIREYDILVDTYNYAKSLKKYKYINQTIITRSTFDGQSLFKNNTLKNLMFNFNSNIEILSESVRSKIDADIVVYDEIKQKLAEYNADDTFSQCFPNPYDKWYKIELLTYADYIEYKTNRENLIDRKIKGYLDRLRQNIQYNTAIVQNSTNIRLSSQYMPQRQPPQRQIRRFTPY